MQNRDPHRCPGLWPKIASHREEGARRNLGEIGPNKEEQLREATKPSHPADAQLGHHQPPSSHQSPTLLCHPAPHTAHVPVFGTPCQLTQPPCARVYFFSLSFSWFFTYLSLFFFFGSFFFLFLSFPFLLLLSNRKADFVQSNVQILSNRGNLIT